MLFVCVFTVLRPDQEFFFYFYRDVTTAGEGLQNLGLCLALRAFEQGGIYIVPLTRCDTGPRFFPVSSEGLSHSVASYGTHEDVEDIF
jgi:hypothetical protein